MAENQHNTPKLSERFSGLFGVEDPALELSVSDAPESVYIEESRKLNLNKLLHLAPYSEVLLLLGEPAVGRTSLLKAFVERAATTWHLSFVTATAVMDGVTFLRQVCQGFEQSLGNYDSTADLLWELDRYLQGLGRSGRRAIIIVDDAHLLTDDVILLAERMLGAESTESSISLILSMRKDQANKLDRFALLKERLAYTLLLEPFNEKEVAGYLLHRMSNTQPQIEELLTPELVADIHKKSGGLPEEIDALAHGMLVKKGRSSTGGGLILKVGGLIAIIAVAGSGLYFQDEINKIFAGAESEPQAEIAEVVEPESSASSVTLDEYVASNLEDADGKPVPQAAIAPMADDIPTSEAEPGADEMASEKDTTMSDVAESQLSTTEEPVVPVAKSEVTPVVTAEIVAKSEIKPEPKLESKPQSKPAAVAKTEVKVSPELEWLKTQPANNYTMQMMALVDKPKVLRFVEKHKLAGKSATYPITKRGKVLTVLVYGSYASRAEASKAAKALPKSWGEPWIRSFADARKDQQKK